MVLSCSKGVLAGGKVPLPWKRRASGKVREIFELDEERLLLVATDRVSAFDQVLGYLIPDKGVLLTRLSLWWFRRLGNLMPHHVLEPQEALLKDLLGDWPEWILRSTLVKRLKPLPVEAIVRGYLSGRAYRAYQRGEEVGGVRLPEALRCNDPLPRPLFTPTTKSQVGTKDQALGAAAYGDLLGEALAKKVEFLSIQLYEAAAYIAHRAGFCLLDAKFEFGLDSGGVLHLIDELLTPDSARYVPLKSQGQGLDVGQGRGGHFDKEFLRDYLRRQEAAGEPPVLSKDFIGQLNVRYQAVDSALRALDNSP